MFFEKIYCINLDKRVDRWEDSLKEFDKLNLNVERFSAFEGDNRHRAFNKSQWTVLKKAVDEGFNNFLVLEDDVQFVNHDHLEDALLELPNDYDLVYLGANINGTNLDRYTDHLFKIRNSFTTHAIGYSHKMAKWIVDNFPFHKDEYEREGLTIYDEWLRVNVQEQFKCFLVAPMCAWQRKSYSNIWNNEADYSRCFIDGNAILNNLWFTA